MGLRTTASMAGAECNQVASRPLDAETSQREPCCTVVARDRRLDHQSAKEPCHLQHVHQHARHFTAHETAVSMAISHVGVATSPPTVGGEVVRSAWFTWSA